MRLEQPPIDGAPPGKASLTQVSDRLYKWITGDGDRDGYLKREAPPTPEQQAHRNLYVKLNQRDRLS